ncbi:MAG: leucine-rich repeat domain-containing protein [Clostridia bacterium]|nr:leucine-rich repeat domain-containing protein [Clostridium sp.]
MRNLNKRLNKKERGITLIALVITITVLLILAGLSIAMLTGDNGILTEASNAKIETVLGTIKEQIKLLQMESRIEEKEVTPETLLAEGKVSRTVKMEDDGKYYMYYSLKDNSIEGMQGLGRGDITNFKDIFLIDENLNIKYISSNGKEYGDEINKKVLEDETEIRFSSKAFSEYISKKSGVPEDEMKFKWMKNQTSLTIADKAVDSLEDLVFFPNLISLTLGEYGSNIPPIISMNGIENCTKLSNLDIIYGPDKEYSAVAKLSNLKSFSRFNGNDYNNIIDALKFCENLEKVSLSQVKVTNMNRIAELGNLKLLRLTGSQIKKIEGLKNMTNLEELYLAGNQIKEIEGLENLTKLKKLFLNSNQIADITPLSANTSLMELNLKSNVEIDANRTHYTTKQLQALDKIGKIIDNGGIINLDTDKLGLFTNYKKLDLSNNKLTTLDNLNGMTELTQLTLTNNSITLEDEKSQEILSNMSNLSYLAFSNNKLTNINAINNLKNLNSLSLIGNNKIDLKQIEDIISNLNTFQVSTESLKTIINCDISKITKLNLNGSDLTELPNLSIFTSLRTLSLNSNPITNFEVISDITSLQTLSLYNCNLHGRMIDFSNLTNLTYLNLNSNSLWTEDLENLKALKNNTNLSIDLSNNSIIDATALLELNSNIRINLKGNVNLLQDSKDKLKAKFGNNVTF